MNAEEAKKVLEYGDKVFVRGTFIREYDNGNVRISFAPDLNHREFPVFEMNIPKDALVH